jgi:hypothetical protein
MAYFIKFAAKIQLFFSLRKKIAERCCNFAPEIKNERSFFEE